MRRGSSIGCSERHLRLKRVGRGSDLRLQRVGRGSSERHLRLKRVGRGSDLRLQRVGRGNRERHLRLQCMGRSSSVGCSEATADGEVLYVVLYGCILVVLHEGQ